MKSKQPASRPQIRRSVAHGPPRRTAQPGASEQATTGHRLAVRTELKAGLLLTALLLQQQAAAGATAGGGVVT